MRAQNVEGSNMSIYGACFQDRVSHETDSAGQTHSTRQREPQISPLLRVEVRFCRPPLPAGHPDHRKPHPMFKPCARANGKGDNHRCHRCAAAWKLDLFPASRPPVSCVFDGITVIVLSFLTFSNNLRHAPAWCLVLCSFLSQAALQHALDAMR